MKIDRAKVAAMLREERRVNRLMSPRYQDTNAQLRRKVYGNVRINHDGDSLTLDPTTPGEYGDGTGEAFPPYAWPGGYTIEFVAADGSVLCADCARLAVLCDRETLHYDTYDEGPEMECDGGCGKRLESSYGEPDAEEEEAAEVWPFVTV